MARITLRIPEVTPSPEDRPSSCPFCSHPALQRWGRTRKPLRDPHLCQVEVHRYRCPRCRRTFRHYPPGVTRWTQSRRTVALSALLWALGLSLRSVASLLPHLGLPLSRMSVLRDVRALQEAVKHRLPRRARVLGVDGCGVRVRGKAQGVLVGVEMGGGLPLLVLPVDEKDPKAVASALRPLAQALGVEVLVSDDLGSYRTVAETLRLEHQVCAFHVRRWAGRALARLRAQVPEAWREVVEEAGAVLRARPPDGGRRLFALYRQVVQGVGKRKERSLEELARVWLRLSEEWGRYTLDRRVWGVPATNNRVEQAIGRFRWRARGMRGIKTWAGVEAALLLSHLQVA